MAFTSAVRGHTPTRGRANTRRVLGRSAVGRGGRVGGEPSARTSRAASGFRLHGRIWFASSAEGRISTCPLLGVQRITSTLSAEHGHRCGAGAGRGVGHVDGDMHPPPVRMSDFVAKATRPLRSRCRRSSVQLLQGQAAPRDPGGDAYRRGPLEELGHTMVADPDYTLV